MPSPRARRLLRPGLAAAATLACLALAAPAAGAGLRPLHAQPDPVGGGRIVDDRGREVLLRGVNVNAFGDYWKGSAASPILPFGARDADGIQGIGWNVVRLILSWSRVEPA